MYRVKRWKYVKKQSKYGNVSVIFQGKQYASKFEAKYAHDLEIRRKAKEIDRWERQVKISLDVNGKHICNYYIDFVVYYPDGRKEFVEVKGFETEVWRLKWRLFEAIMETDEPNSTLTIIKK